MIRRRTLIPYMDDLLVAELNTTEAFVLSALRLWNSELSEADGTLPKWRQGFAHARVNLAGTLAFDRFCRMLAIAALRTPRVQPISCRFLSQDEGLLLHVLAHIQHDHIGLAECALRQICLAEAARILVNAARVVTGALISRNLWLPERMLLACASPAIAGQAMAAQQVWLH
jgi:hypothetical protein